MKQYDAIERYSDGSAYVKRNGKYGYLNAEGEETIPCLYDHLETITLHTDLLRVEVDGKVGVFDKSGREVIACRYEEMDPYPYGEDLPIRVRLHGRYGFISKQGEVLIQPLYEKASVLANDKAVVQSGGKWGLIDRTGKLLIPFEHDAVSIREACGAYGHCFKFVRCVDVGYNVSTDEYECLRCGQSELRLDYHWSQD